MSFLSRLIPRLKRRKKSVLLNQGQRDELVKIDRDRLAVLTNQRCPYCGYPAMQSWHYCCRCGVALIHTVFYSDVFKEKTTDATTPDEFMAR
jgi:hypothetical protein